MRRIEAFENYAWTRNWVKYFDDNGNEWDIHFEKARETGLEECEGLSHQLTEIVMSHRSAIVSWAKISKNNIKIAKLNKEHYTFLNEIKKGQDAREYHKKLLSIVQIEEELETPEMREIYEHICDVEDCEICGRLCVYNFFKDGNKNICEQCAAGREDELDEFNKCGDVYLVFRN